MSESKAVRLAKVAKECNVSIPTIVDFLAKKSIVIESNPNTKIEGDVYDMLLSNYQADVKVKEKAMAVSIGRETRETIAIGTMADKDAEKAAERAAKVDTVPAKAEEAPQAAAPVAPPAPVVPQAAEPVAEKPAPTPAPEPTPVAATPAPEPTPEHVSAPVNELVHPAEETASVIRIDDHANVTFTGLDAMFDSEHPEQSDLIEGTLEDGLPYADDDDDDEDASGLEILDGAGEPLGGDDIEDLEGAGKQKGGDPFGDAVGSAPDDYDVLV